jgi:hypothetical protein
MEAHYYSVVVEPIWLQQGVGQVENFNPPFAFTPFLSLRATHTLTQVQWLLREKQMCQVVSILKCFWS